MTFKAQMATDVNNVFFNDTEFADDGIYNSSDGSIVDLAIKVILDLGADLGSTDYGVAELVAISLKTSDVARPAVYDTVEIDDTVYMIINSSGGFEFAVVRSRYYWHISGVGWLGS